MFGYISINKAEMKFKDYDVYHSYYCGLCKVLKECYGRRGQVTLSFDMTFLVILLTGLYEPDTKTEMVRCIAHPMQKHAAKTNEFTEYAAAINMLLSYYKCEDDWADEHRKKAFVAAKLLHSKIKKIEKLYPVKCKVISENLAQISKYEAENEQNLDLICIAGDIYDNDFDAIDNPDEISRLLGKLQSTYGTFACYGNHDVSEQLLGGFSTEEGIQYLRDPRMDQMLKNAGITPLTDEARLIDRSFYLVGRLDASKTGVSGLRPKTIDEFTKTLDTSKPIFVLEHQPGELKEEEKSGVDLSMAGHTHNGQLFPGNLLVSLMWTNSYGHYQSGDFHSIVTSGLGVWGPNMRVGTDSEIVIIDVTFQ